jgi:hypothetical protein
MQFNVKMASPFHVFVCLWPFGIMSVFMGKPSSENIIVTPLAPALFPLGGVGAYDPSELPVQIFSAFLRTGNTSLSQPGRLSGGAKPLER